MSLRTRIHANPRMAHAQIASRANRRRLSRATTGSRAASRNSRITVSRSRTTPRPLQYSRDSPAFAPRPNHRARRSARRRLQRTPGSTLCGLRHHRSPVSTTLPSGLPMKCQFAPALLLIFLFHGAVAQMPSVARAADAPKIRYRDSVRPSLAARALLSRGIPF
jgi:hypothetical protein